ncbi:LETM1 domain-containing protein 1 [Nymphon striatum]|nr:LETM1 domain-containing protein 1 [Nymphon striatum]
MLSSVFSLIHEGVSNFNYMFPKLLLCQHFWSIEEKLKFSYTDHKKQILHYKSVLDIVQEKALQIENVSLQPILLKILYKLKSGTHPGVDEVLSIKKLFDEPPFSLASMSSRHLTELCKMHGVSSLIFKKRTRLQSYAGFTREIDLAMNREGMLNMEAIDMQLACFNRGLNPIGLSRNDMIIWLQNWIHVTKSLDRFNLSLLLHTTIFLSYNAPTNWSVIHNFSKAVPS